MEPLFLPLKNIFLKTMKMKLHTDGGARGNPGPGAGGVVLIDEKNKVMRELGTFFGVCTNNEAEYRALILGLETAKSLGATELKGYMDSELVVEQMNGNYKVKNQNLRKFWEEAQILAKTFNAIEFIHVRRENNAHADKLVNEVLDAAE